MINMPAPISDAQANALAATARATEKATDVLAGLGDYLREVFGTVPHDLVGYFGGDLLKIRRAENIRRILEISKEKLARRSVSHPEPASLSVSLPIMVAASDESREELQEIWASLLAAAAAPHTRRRFRNAFIEIAKKLDPLDAVTLQGILFTKGKVSNAVGYIDIEQYNKDLRAFTKTTSHDELQVSLANLETLGLVSPAEMLRVRSLKPLGREFLRAVLDAWPEELKG